MSEKLSPHLDDILMKNICSLLVFLLIYVGGRRDNLHLEKRFIGPFDSNALALLFTIYGVDIGVEVGTAVLQQKE